jgi:hypothetical protein
MKRSITRKVYALTAGHCWYCGTILPAELSGWHCDHKLPKSRGGRDEIANLVPACPRCNIRKQTKTVDEFRRFLEGRLEHLITLSYEYTAELDAFADQSFDLKAMLDNLYRSALLATEIAVTFYGERIQA